MDTPQKVYPSDFFDWLIFMPKSMYHALPNPPVYADVDMGLAVAVGGCGCGCQCGLFARLLLYTAPPPPLLSLPLLLSSGDSAVRHVDHSVPSGAGIRCIERDVLRLLHRTPLLGVEGL